MPLTAARRAVGTLVLALALVVGATSTTTVASAHARSPHATAAKKARCKKHGHKTAHCNKHSARSHRGRRGRRGRIGPAGPGGPVGPAGPAGPGATKFLYDAAPSAAGTPRTLFTVAGYTVGARCTPDLGGGVRLTLTQHAAVPLHGVQSNSISLDGGGTTTTTKYADQAILNAHPAFALIAHGGQRSVGFGSSGFVAQGTAVMIQLSAVAQAVGGQARCTVSGTYL